MIDQEQEQINETAVEQEANARLIAAAPAMLAALKSIYRLGRTPFETQSRHMANIAEDAIRAAEGSN